ncbi:MAG: hypothetical protein AAF740_07030 [Bacteroidota bacterium]
MDQLLGTIFRIVIWMEKYRVYQVTSQEEQSEVYAFATRVFAEKGYPTQNAEVLDHYTDKAALFVVRHRGQIVATMRLIDTENNCRLQDFWNVRLPEGVSIDRVRELGTMAVAKSHRGKSRIPIMDLLEIAVRYSKKNGIKWWCASAEEKDYYKFRRFNPNCQLLEKLPLTEHQREFRARHAQYFDTSCAHVWLFIFTLEKGLYLRNIKQMLTRKLFGKQTFKVSPVKPLLNSTRSHKSLS